MHDTWIFLAVACCFLVILLSTCSAVPVSVELLELHGPDGQTVFVSQRQVNSLRQPTAADLHRYFPKPARCIVLTTDGKFIAVVETCQAIRDLLTR